jgi:MoaA/NifB/PqqE/SkfB family radical SAM enzyme
MFQQLANWLKERIRGRPFEALQIEVTSRCCLKCEMCPRSALAPQWPEVNLSWEAFERIASAFRYVRHVHLQGWGEPLLHPRLFEMIAAVKAAGCRVGLTTNGMGLDRETAGKLVAADLNLLSVSIAGATRETHEHLRVSSSFFSIVENVREIVRQRAEHPPNALKIELSYLMTKTNIAELPQAVELAGSLGVDELYAINLDYVVTPAHDGLKVFDRASLRDGFVRIVEEAQERARRADLAFRIYPLDLEEVAVCEAQPTKILFVSCEGWVSPCTYLALPGMTEIPRCFQGKPVRVPAARFGNVLEQGLMNIWENPAYRAFRKSFADRRLALAARSVAAVSGTAGAEWKMPPPPEPCRTCYKLYGV